jgi:hypothetical protein
LVSSGSAPPWQRRVGRRAMPLRPEHTELVELAQLLIARIRRGDENASHQDATLLCVSGREPDGLYVPHDTNEGFQPRRSSRRSGESSPSLPSPPTRSNSRSSMSPPRSVGSLLPRRSNSRA